LWSYFKWTRRRARDSSGNPAGGARQITFGQFGLWPRVQRIARPQGRHNKKTIIKDENKDITGISYNHLGLPILIQFGTTETGKLNTFTMQPDENWARR